MALRMAVLSLVVIGSKAFTAVAADMDRMVHIMVDASASFAQVDLAVAAAMRQIAPPPDMVFKVLRWDTDLVPSSEQDWTAQGLFQLEFPSRGGGTQLGQSLQELLAQSRQAQETCTRVVIVVHGATSDEPVLRTALASARPSDFIKLLMTPLEAPDEASDPMSVLGHYQKIIDGFAPRGTPSAEQFSVTALDDALKAADEHRCLPQMM